jgi:D-alanyl-D-alanine carboxypeptidase
MASAAGRLGAWSAGVLLALGPVATGCSASDEPGADPPRPTAGTSGAASEGAAADTDAAAADAAAAAIEERMAVYEGIFPGILALLRVGAETRFVTIGEADRDTGSEMRPHDRFVVGSVTKPMVATLVLQLVESGRVRLSDTVERWLPGLVPGGGRITLEQLLSHRSGLPDYFDHVNIGQAYEPEQLVKVALAEGERTAPGTGAYSNTNFVLLGLIVEKATGRPLAQQLEHRVFGPAGMRDASLAPAGGGDPEIRGYTKTTDVTPTDRSGAWAAGGVVASARDLDSFVTSLVQGDLLSRSTVRDMTTSRGRLTDLDIDYGLGVQAGTVSCGDAVGHFGVVRGFATAMWALDGGNRSVVVMVNDAAGQGVVGELIEPALCS